MQTLIASTPDLTNWLIALAGSGGLIGAAVGFFKITSERDSRAVSQAQGAMETMVALNDVLEDSLKRANERGDYYKQLHQEAIAELEQIRHRWGPFPIDEES